MNAACVRSYSSLIGQEGSQVELHAVLSILNLPSLCYIKVGMGQLK